MIANQLYINMSKCCYMHFTPNHRNSENNDASDHALQIMDVPVKDVKFTHFLRVIIDDKL